MLWDIYERAIIGLIFLFIPSLIVDVLALYGSEPRYPSIQKIIKFPFTPYILRLAVISGFDSLAPYLGHGPFSLDGFLSPWYISLITSNPQPLGDVMALDNDRL